MPIRGAIQADYSAFVDECAKAEAGLAKIEGQGKQTELSLVKMEQSVSAGTVSKAIEKTVVSVDKAGQAAKASASSFGVMSEGLKVADKTLNQFGVNLGPTIGSLDEFAKMSGQTTTSLGRLGTAAAVAGTAFAGWNIGRWIADLTGADAAVADFASTLMGTGSVAAETYGAKLDAVQLAIRRGYEGLPSYTEAIRYNADWAQKNAAQHVTSAARISEWTRELQNATGGQAALRGEIDAGNLTVEEMSQRFHVSARAIDFLKKTMEASRQETDAHAKASERAAAEAQKHADAVAQLQAQLFGTDKIAKAAEYQTALGGIANLTRLSKEAQASLNTTIGEAIEAYGRMGEVAPQAMRDLYLATIQLPQVVTGLGQEWANVGEKVAITADAVVADMQRMTAETTAYEAETQAMVDAYVRMQYGAEGATTSIQGTTSATQQLTVQLQQLESQARSTFERLQAGQALVQAYRDAGVATGMQIATGGYTFQQQRQTLLPTWASTGPAPGAGQPWGNQNTLNVNVNNADAGKIAEKLVGEMRHSGYRL